jgi:hypothetical protein
MSEHEHRNWKIVFFEKQDEDGTWLDEVELNIETGTLGVDLKSIYAKQHKIEKFKTKEEALASGLRKARAFISKLDVAVSSPSS